MTLDEQALARAAHKAVALAQREKSAWTRADVPRSGRAPDAAAALLEDLADRALRSEFGQVVGLEAPEPVQVPVQLAARTGVAATGATASFGMRPSRS